MRLFFLPCYLYAVAVFVFKIFISALSYLSNLHEVLLSLPQSGESRAALPLRLPDRRFRVTEHCGPAEHLHLSRMGTTAHRLRVLVAPAHKRRCQSAARAHGSMSAGSRRQCGRASDVSGICCGDRCSGQGREGEEATGRVQGRTQGS